MECGTPIGLQVLHRPDDPAVVIRLVPLDVDIADLHLRTLGHVEGDAQRRRRDLLDLRIHGGVLPAALGQEILERDGGALHLVGVVLRFHREADFALLEPVQDLRHGDGLDAFVVDGADDAPLGEDEADEQAVRPGLGLQADVVEPAGVPQRHEIAPEDLFVEQVAAFADDHGAQSVLRHAAGAAELDVVNDVSRDGSARWRGGFRRLELRLSRRRLGGGGRRSGRRLLGGLLRDVLERISRRLLGLSGGLLLGRSPSRWSLRRRRLGREREAESAETDGRDQQADAPGELHANIPFHSALLRRFTEDRFTGTADS